MSDRYMIPFEYDRAMQTRELLPKMPTFHFPQDWPVKIWPPFAGATVRMQVKGYSIYLDCFDNLGCVGKPYWELYNGDDCERFLLGDEADMMTRLEELPFRNGEA